jgi:hypothetical protein
MTKAANPCDKMFSLVDCAPKQVVIATQCRPLSRHEGDHFQPHYRMPFALMRGRKDGLFFVDPRPVTAR